MGRDDRPDGRSRARRRARPAGRRRGRGRVRGDPGAPSRGSSAARTPRIRARVRPVSREKPGERRRRPERRARAATGGDGGRARRSRRPRQPARHGAGRPTAARDGRRRRRAGERRRVRAARRGGAPAARGAVGATAGAGSRAPSAAIGPTARRRRGQEEAVSEDSVSVEEQAEEAADFTAGPGRRVRRRCRREHPPGGRRRGHRRHRRAPTSACWSGPKGATLQAIEELVRTVVQRRTEGHGARIHVDVGGYRAKRRAALERFALELAEQVRESGEDRALEPMSASDRKVVHDAIATLDGVTTTSEGEEPRRRVVVRPASTDAPVPDDLDEVLRQAQDLGFLGPGPIASAAPPRRGRCARWRWTASSPEAPLEFLDLGSGGGLPGLVLALGAARLRPLSGILLDAQQRRTASSQEAVDRLGLADRIAGRDRPGRGRRPGSEPHRERYDLVVARAFGPPAVTAECAVAFLRPGGRLVVSEPPDPDSARWDEEPARRPRPLTSRPAGQRRRPRRPPPPARPPRPTAGPGSAGSPRSAPSGSPFHVKRGSCPRRVRRRRFHVEPRPSRGPPGSGGTSPLRRRRTRHRAAAPSLALGRPRGGRVSACSRLTPPPGDMPPRDPRPRQGGPCRRPPPRRPTRSDGSRRARCLVADADRRTGSFHSDAAWPEHDGAGTCRRRTGPTRLDGRMGRATTMRGHELIHRPRVRRAEAESRSLMARKKSRRRGRAARRFPHQSHEQQWCNSRCAEYPRLPVSLKSR